MNPEAIKATETNTKINAAEFRALLDLWMVCDPFPEGVDNTAFEALLTREALARGYVTIPDAYHRHCADGPDAPTH